jgi:hypothetical protein
MLVLLALALLTALGAAWSVSFAVVALIAVAISVGLHVHAEGSIYERKHP